MKLKLNAIIIAVAFLLPIKLNAQQILSFKIPYGSNGKQTEALSTTTNANLLQSTLSRGKGAKASSSSGYTFNANMAYSATKEKAKENGSYFEFFIQAKSGYKVSLTAINAIIRMQSKSADTYRWMYSTDNGATFIELGNKDVTIADTNNDGVVQAEIPITELNDIAATTKVVFRMYAWGGDPYGDYTNTAFGLGKSLNTGRNIISVKGSVKASNN